MGKVSFGYLEIFGREFKVDVVVCGKEVRERRKELSGRYRSYFNHTPLSEEELHEYLRWCREPSEVVIGSGIYGALPLTEGAKKLLEELEGRGTEVRISRTSKELVEEIEASKGRVLAVIHITC